MRWRVTFLLEEWDELRSFEVDADSERDAIVTAEREHPWEAEISVSTTAIAEGEYGYSAGC
jgi:hypothetical protein